MPGIHTTALRWLRAERDTIGGFRRDRAGTVVIGADRTAPNDHDRYGANSELMAAIFNVCFGRPARTMSSSPQQ